MDSGSSVSSTLSLSAKKTTNNYFMETLLWHHRSCDAADASSSWLLCFVMQTLTGRGRCAAGHASPCRHCLWLSAAPHRLLRERRVRGKWRTVLIISISTLTLKRNSTRYCIRVNLAFKHYRALFVWSSIIVLWWLDYFHAHAGPFPQASSLHAQSSPTSANVAFVQLFITC